MVNFDEYIIDDIKLQKKNDYIYNYNKFLGNQSVIVSPVTFGNLYDTGYLEKLKVINNKINGILKRNKHVYIKDSLINVLVNNDVRYKCNKNTIKIHNKTVTFDLKYFINNYENNLNLYLIGTDDLIKKINVSDYTNVILLNKKEKNITYFINDVINERKQKYRC